MANPNATLADILDREAAVAESGQLLAAIIDGGVFVPVNVGGSVMFAGGSVPGYATAELCAAAVPDAFAEHCDVFQLVDIHRRTELTTLTVFSSASWAEVPFPLLTQTLAERGRRLAAPETVTLGRSTHPVAVGLRSAFAARIGNFPGIDTVWLADARWEASDLHQIMVHVAVTDDAAPGADKHLLEAVLTEDITIGPQDPPLSARTLHTTRDAATIANLDRLALDTIRIDRTTGQVHVTSREPD